MNISTLVFDLDGTAIPKDPKGMPSVAVINAVNKAKEKWHVSIATGRPYSLCKDIISVFEIEEACIVNGGTHLYSPREEEYIWKQEIDPLTLQEVFYALKEYSNYQVADEKHMDRVALPDYQTDQAVGLSCIFSATHEDAKAIKQIVDSFKGVTAVYMSSWLEGTYDIHISHELATKKHALQSLLARMNVDHSEVMVVGDGGNDLPLFELAGLKVAMGNAPDELKNLADWIAPPVDQDGLAVAIEKYYRHT